ncbi:MAG TPA: hypothetical protein GXX28_09460 [Firmicutes bacterium]|nr:hypothetical protein [Bacillota bacterium]
MSHTLVNPLMAVGGSGLVKGGEGVVEFEMAGAAARRKLRLTEMATKSG